MTSDTQDFQLRLTALLTDLKNDGRKDPEAMWLIGSLATRLIDSSGSRDWPSLKAGLTAESYDNMLSSFQTQGNALYKQGKPKATYAIQVLAMSLIATRMRDETIARGARLLDELIAATVKAYRAGPPAEPASA